MTRIGAAAVIVISVAQPFRGRHEISQPAPRATSVTYNNDIARLIADRCVMCHHDGGSAPFTLDTFDDVKRRAALIATVTRNRYMPPWKADPSNGPFLGQHPLSDAEIALIAEWAAGGAIEGDSSEAAKADLSRRSREAAKAEAGPRCTRIRPACSVAPASWIRRVSMRIAPSAATRRWRARWTWAGTPSSAK
jgi:mono/diheme cytochrome c family protein